MKNRKPKNLLRDPKQMNLTEEEMLQTIKDFGFDGLFDIHTDQFNAQKAFYEDVIMEQKPLTVNVPQPNFFDQQQIDGETDTDQIHHLPSFLKPEQKSIQVKQVDEKDILKILTVELNRLSEQYIQPLIDAFKSYPSLISQILIDFLVLCDDQQNTIPTLAVLMYGLKLNLKQCEYFAVLNELCLSYQKNHQLQVIVLLCYCVHYDSFSGCLLIELMSQQQIDLQMLLKILRICGKELKSLPQLQILVQALENQIATQSTSIEQQQIFAVQLRIIKDMMNSSHAAENIYTQLYLLSLQSQIIEIRKVSSHPDYPMDHLSLEQLKQAKSIAAAIVSSKISPRQIELSRQLNIHHGGMEFKLMLVLANSQPGFPKMSNLQALHQFRQFSDYFNKCVEATAKMLIQIVELADVVDYYYIDCCKILATSLPRNADFVGKQFKQFVDMVETKGSRAVGNVARLLAHMLGQKVEYGRIQNVAVQGLLTGNPGKRGLVFLDIVILTLLSGQVAQCNFLQSSRSEDLKELFPGIKQIGSNFLKRMENKSYAAKIVGAIKVSEDVVQRMRGFI